MIFVRSKKVGLAPAALHLNATGIIICPQLVLLSAAEMPCQPPLALLHPLPSAAAAPVGAAERGEGRRRSQHAGEGPGV